MTMSKAKETLFKVILNEPDWTSRLIEAIPDAIVIVDTDGVVQYVNAGYLRLAGLKREDIIGKDAAGIAGAYGTEEGIDGCGMKTALIWQAPLLNHEA
jgi:PAS domain-containing protein